VRVALLLDQIGQPAADILDDGVGHAVGGLRLQAQVDLIVDIVHGQELAVGG
jgi:hypothetical protein